MGWIGLCLIRVRVVIWRRARAGEVSGSAGYYLFLLASGAVNLS